MASFDSWADALKHFVGNGGFSISSGGNSSVDVVPRSRAGTPANRQIASVLAIHPGDGTSNVAYWAAAEKVHEVTIPANMRFVVNLSDAAAKIALEDAGGDSVTVLYDRTYADPRSYSQTSPITQLDMSSLSGGNQTNLTIGAST